jgi:hypothetical protein
MNYYIDETGQLVHPCEEDGWVYVIDGVGLDESVDEYMACSRMMFEFKYEFRYDLHLFRY